MGKKKKGIFKYGGKSSLRSRLIFMMVVGWIVPITIIFLFITVSYRRSIIVKTEAILTDSLKNFTSSVSIKINEAVQISKKISYDKELEEAWKSYNNEKINDTKLYNTVISILTNKFFNDRRFSMSCFYFTDDKDKLHFKSRERDRNSLYKKEVHEVALKISEENTSDARVKVINGRIYIIRNLYTTTGYKKYGTLTVELNKSLLFEEASVNDYANIAFFINQADSIAMVENYSMDEEMRELFEKLKNTYSNSSNNKATILKEGKYAAILYEMKNSDYHIGSFSILDQKEMYIELEKLNNLMLYTWIVIIPILICLYLFLRANITMPMIKIIRFAKDVRKGNIGAQLEVKNMPNLEFEELKISLNKMSLELKNLFDYGYNEELARKDTKIIALQSQINPHFLNNTLEMMNWQARMSGDITVSKMIEALGTLLDYSMDRNSRRLISLAEELRCADAYFYIISMRFGQRLTVEKEIDETLLQVQVPQLILQPILENAVVHGVETILKGNIWLKVNKENENIVIRIINTGKDMTEADIKRVEEILSGAYKVDTDEPGKHVSLGIRNVNERIQLIYGEEYGLTIRPLEEGKTVSTIVIPFERKTEDKKDKVYKDLMK